ncbi:MAG: tRNA guanosine(34) transglycosylase Tgt [Candidatus Aminicenantia bacterium]
MDSAFSFKIIKRDEKSRARAGIITTPHGKIHTPVFAPVASQGAVKAIIHKQLEEFGTEVLVSNVYHLFIRPGVETIEKFGGLHNFISWKRAILTDSGGFQIYSLSSLRKIDENGVKFSSHVDGKKFYLTPEDVLKIQLTLGSDIIMILDCLLPYPSSHQAIRKAVNLTVKWAERTMNVWKALGNNKSGIFGIIQGGTEKSLRSKCLEDLLKLGFSGYAIGGLFVGEPREDSLEVIEHISSLIPEDYPRYLMGSGTPEDIFEAVEMGVDIFDCVLPTRNARTGTLFTYKGKVLIKQARYAEDSKPIDPDCGCYTCRNFSRAYLRHLFKADELNSFILNTIHNLYFYLDIMKKIRQSILFDNFKELKEKVLKGLKEKEE